MFWKKIFNSYEGSKAGYKAYEKEKFTEHYAGEVVEGTMKLKPCSSGYHYCEFLIVLLVRFRPFQGKYLIKENRYVHYTYTEINILGNIVSDNYNYESVTDKYRTVRELSTADMKEILRKELEFFQEMKANKIRKYRFYKVNKCLKMFEKLPEEMKV